MRSGTPTQFQFHQAVSSLLRMQTSFTFVGLLRELVENLLEFGWWDNRITILGYGVLGAGHIPVLVGSFLVATVRPVAEREVCEFRT